MSSTSRDIVEAQVPSQEINCITILSLFKMRGGQFSRQTSDFRVMKDVAEITRLPPARRLGSVQQLVQTLRSSPEAQAKLAEWGLEVCPDVVTLKARKLDPVTLHFGGGAKEVRTY